MITREQVVQLAQSCGFTTGEYNAGDGTGRKIPFVAFDGINMLAALERFVAMAYTAWQMAPTTDESSLVDEDRERAELPKLPKPEGLRRKMRGDGGYDMLPCFTADQMRDYARAALREGN